MVEKKDDGLDFLRKEAKSYQNPVDTKKLEIVIAEIEEHEKQLAQEHDI